MAIDIDKEIELLEKAQEEFEKFKGLMDAEEIPTDLKKAVDTKWEIGVAVAGMVGAVAAYDPEKRRQDRQRAIPLSIVIDAIGEMETRIVSDQVVDVPGLYLGKFKKWIDTAIAVWQRLSIIRLLLNFNEEVIKLLAFMARHAAASITVGVAIKAITAVMKRKNRVEIELRSRALPQRTGKRYRRRKVAR